jgi:hypothetical protein
MRARAILAALLFATAPGPGAAGQPDRFAAALDLARAGQGAAAAAMFLQLAQAGDTAAQVNLAVLQARGLGVPQDEAGAAYWAWRARLSGERRAAALGDHLMTRLTDDARAALAERLMQDLTARAETGDAQALLGLGRVETEIRAPARPQEAALWFTLAAAFEVRHALALREVTMRGLAPEERLAVQARAGAEFARWCGLVPAAARPRSCPRD